MPRWNQPRHPRRGCPAAPQPPTVTIVGLGPGDLAGLSVGALQELERATRILLRTERHPVVAQLRARGLELQALDAEYEAAPDFETLYRRLVQRVLDAAEEGDVVYAVPGHPLVGERSVVELLRRTEDGTARVRIVPSPGFLDAVLPALARVGIPLPGDDLDLRDATGANIVPSRVDVAVFYFQVYDRDVASALKVALLEEYPPEHGVHVVRWAGVPERECVTSLPLYELDRPTSGAFDHLTTLYVPPVPEEARRPTFADLAAVTARLRGPGGCPWDREQTHASLKRYMIEEAYEAVEAIDGGDPAVLADELGDVLFQVVIHAQLAQEDGQFDIRDVVGNITRKLIRRHPWVFGDVQVSSAADALRNWEAIKQTEKPEEAERASVLDAVPRHLPALLKALDVSKRVVKVGFEWPSLEDVLHKLDEEVRELHQALPRGDRAELEAEIGDLLFTVVNVARWLKIDPEEALRAMVTRFSERFRRVEQMAAGGKPLHEMTLAELDALWEKAKEELAQITPNRFP